MVTKAFPSDVDLTLTPQNAEEKGYEYIDDVIYDKYNPNESVKDILDLINQHGHKLGKPSAQNDMGSYFGFYAEANEFLESAGHGYLTDKERINIFES